MLLPENTGKELDKVRKTIIINGASEQQNSGKSAYEIAKLAGVNVPEDTKILIGEVESVDIMKNLHTRNCHRYLQCIKQNI